MALGAKWSVFAENVVPSEQDRPGVYELGGRAGETDYVAYIGTSDAVRRRLLEHLNEPASSCIKKYAPGYRVHYTPNFQQLAREIYDEYVRVHGQPPICNTVRP